MPSLTTPQPQTTTHHRKRKNDRRKNELDQDDENGEAEAVDCEVSAWSDWTECSTTCGKSYKYKTRMIKRKAENGGKKCPKKLEKRKRCDVPKCREYSLEMLRLNSVGNDDDISDKRPKVDCQVSPWSKWSSCSASCGQGFKYKRRTISQQPSRGGKKCPSRLERRRECKHLPVCSE